MFLTFNIYIMNVFTKDIADKEIIWWAWDTEDPYVFKIWDLGIDQKMFPMLESPDLQVFVQGNYIETKQACTYVNGIRDRWHRFGIKFTDYQIIEIIQWMVDNGYYWIGDGYDTWQAMKNLAKYFNKFYPQHPCYYARINMDDPMFAYALSRNHSIGFTYKWNAQWNTDRLDGMLEGKEYMPSTYWHRSCLIKKDKQITVDDSSPIKQYGIKYLKDLNMGKWGKNIYWWFYVWIADEKKVSDQLKKYYKRKVRLEENIKNNTSMAIDTVDDKFAKECKAENKRLQKKLDFIMKEIKTLDK